MPQPSDSNPSFNESTVTSFLSMRGMWVLSPEQIRYVRDQQTPEQQNASALLNSPWMRIGLAVASLYTIADLVRSFNEKLWLQFLWKLGVVFCLGYVILRPPGQEIHTPIPRDAVRYAEAYPPVFALFGGHIMLHYDEKGILRHQRMPTRRVGEYGGLRRNFLHAVGALEKAGVDVDIVSSTLRPTRATEHVNDR